ncbi:MAG: GntR family transcriptional regulator [Chloroflexi bacterium]|nr:GntR family transcriptional regulator [Chloroflexota bacterium]
MAARKTTAQTPPEGKSTAILLGDTAHSPLFTQIVAQVRQLVATGRLKPGERLPTVRELADTLGVSPGTVVRAYLDLEKQGVVQSRRGAGTFVSASVGRPGASALRRGQLSNIVSGSILEALTLGFEPDEVEAAFSVHLARWREERQRLAATPPKRGRNGNKTIAIVASHDLALNLLVSHLKQRDPRTRVEVTYAGSLGSLIALQGGRADIAGIHLLDGETGEYNCPYVKHVLPNQEVAVVHLAYRVQGMMFAAGNPKRIKGLEDLKRPDVRMLNRQKGSGTRVLLDFQLQQLGIAPRDVQGYETEVDTHLAVADGVARGEADVGMGIEAAARACGADFLPLFRERYDLIIPMETYKSRRLSHLLEIVASEDFRRVVAETGGYDTSQTGATTFCRYEKN